MNSVDSFIELVGHLCRRRHMYCAGGTFFEVCAYLSGYSRASPDCPLSGEGWGAFNQFICARLGFPDKYSWTYVLKRSSPDDDEATARLHQLLTEFAERTKTESFEKIARDEVSRAKGREEIEPVKAWRKFSRAIHWGRKEEIESLIQDHPDAEILWSASYPNGVGPFLDQIEESYLISPISGSEADGRVTIITPDFGSVEVKLIGGTWRIDASKVIDCWKANRDKNHQPPVPDS